MNRPGRPIRFRSISTCYLEFQPSPACVCAMVSREPKGRGTTLRAFVAHFPLQQVAALRDCH